ncbi:hypothetical protein AB205_0084540, partial [Aquarana catesbeiana]
NDSDEVVTIRNREERERALERARELYREKIHQQKENEEKLKKLMEKYQMKNKEREEKRLKEEEEEKKTWKGKGKRVKKWLKNVKKCLVSGLKVEPDVREGGRGGGVPLKTKMLFGPKKREATEKDQITSRQKANIIHDEMPVRPMKRVFTREEIERSMKLSREKLQEWKENEEKLKKLIEDYQKKEKKEQQKKEEENKK